MDNWVYWLLVAWGSLFAAGSAGSIAAYVAVVRYAALERLTAGVLRRGLRRIDASSRGGDEAAYVVRSGKDGASRIRS